MSQTATATPVAAPIVLERASIQLKQGYDYWTRDGSIRHTLKINLIFGRRAEFFRVNATGRIFRVLSRYETVEVPRGLIAWR